MICDFKKKMTNWGHNWEKEFLEHKYLILISILFFVIAIKINFLAANYTNRATTNAVNDLILDHIPTLNLSFIFIYGSISVILVIIIYFVFFKIKDFHLIISQFSLLILIRSIFISLTHLEKPADALILTNLPNIYNLFNFNNDLFFSAHTAIPFLAFLIFRKEKIGKFFLLMSIIMAMTVLFMHVHYSIDVFSAFFITYGGYKLGECVFKKVNHY